MAPFTVTPWMPDVPAVCPALFRLRWSAWPIAIACAPALLQAQTLPAPSAEDTRLPDITVTATRQPERVQDVAAAVGVVKGADARVAGPGMQLSESLVSVPGVAALNRQNMAQDLQISSRAFGARSTFGVRGVRLYEDGIPLTMPDGQGQSSSFDLSQAQRIEVLRGAFRAVRVEHPFEIDAIVILPDHLHTIWTLPPNDYDYALRWKKVKTLFSKRMPKREPRSASRTAKGERGIWQRHYWEHLIRDEEDFQRHFDYVHINPLKHGLVEQVKDWPYSTFHRYAEQGVYPQDWAGIIEEGDFGE